jgi:hypothetical protein
MKIIANYDVGYGRPPKRTQWQKGQCGNPKRIRKRTPKLVVEMIDEFFASQFDIVEQGVSRRVSAFEAIAMQLWARATAGSKRAINVLLQYQAFAARRRGNMGGEPIIEIVREGADGGEPGDGNA